jgi:hypothetical protein
LLWCCRDKLCIDQDNINRALRCLPVFVFSCNRLIILAGNTYCDRLWCVWELYTFFSTSGTRALKQVELYDFSDAGTSTLLEFDVANSHCFSPVDEAKLRSIIESGGASNFNDMIHEGVCEESAVCFCLSWFSQLMPSCCYASHSRARAATYDRLQCSLSAVDVIWDHQFLVKAEARIAERRAWVAP